MLTSDFFNKPTTEEKTRLDPKCWTGKKIGNPKTKMKGGVRVNNCVPVEEETENNPIDTVEMDVPLLIRALEYAREDAKDDMDLHKVVERLIVAAQNGEALNMDDYNMIFGDSESEPVAEGKFDPINDDDFYEYNVNTNEIVARTSIKDPTVRKFTPNPAREWPGRDSNHKIVKGFKAKHLAVKEAMMGFVSSAPTQYRNPQSLGHKHRVTVTMSEPGSKASIQKTLRVSGEDQEDATKRAKAYYERAGYTVHDIEYAGRLVDEAKKKKKKKAKSSLMSKPAKRRYGGYFYPGYGYGDGGDSGGGDGGGGGESRVNEKKEKTKLNTLDLRSELDAHATTLLNIARRKYPMAKSDLAALIKLLDRVQLHSIEKDTAHDKDIKAIRRDVAALEKRVNELYKKQKVKESRSYYTVSGTLAESLRKDFKMRKDRKGWFLPETASSKARLDAERAFGEPINEADLLRPIKLKATKDPVARSKNASKYKNPAKLIQFKQ